MPQNQTLIDQKIAELSRLTNHIWKEAQGYHALTMVDIRTSGVAFNPASGIPIKVFVDTVSGELKMFPASMFESQS